MQFKEDYMMGQWAGKCIDRRLKFLLLGLDCMLRGLHGYEITITCLKEARKSGGYHPKGQAADIRSKDMRKDVQYTLIQLLQQAKVATEPPLPERKKSKEHPRFEWVFEPAIKGKRGEHFHVELDDGEPI